MARSGAVWGIDIGQCALKALRCRATAAGDRIEADAFDFIEYPKILSQPDADPAELIGEALKTFLSRNAVKGDQIAISVPGQAGLARFIKLPPVESKKIPDIVRYEAKQQIPFDLNDVIWDYQRIGLFTEEEGFALETEIGLFAMKRDAVFRALAPYLKADMEIDFIQLTPLALYNFVLFDQMRDLPAPEEYDPDNPPEYVVTMSMGTDSTDLVFTNGYKVWLRSIHIGGNHFTKALTKEMKLTFAQAEHLKRNATAAADPKAVFQAMRPVFNELLVELQRSISYYCNLDRSAKIGRVVALGNTMKLPGLRRYLSQNLGYEIERLETFSGLIGPQVISAPNFQENSLSFGVCYGLGLQGLGKAGIRTNLLPSEIVQDRLIKRKKPWGAGAAAALLLGCTVSYGAYALSLTQVDKSTWQGAEAQASQVSNQSKQLIEEAAKAQGDFDGIDKIGKNLISNVEGRIAWLELMKAVNQALPKDEKERPDNIPDRNELFITNMECQHVADVSQWFTAVSKYYQGPGATNNAAASAAPATNPTTPPGGPATGTPAEAAPGATAPAEGTAPATAGGPTGEGWIVKIEGYHYHNNYKKYPNNFGGQFVQNTFIKNLLNGVAELPKGLADPALEKVPLKELGINYPILYNPTVPYPVQLSNPFGKLKEDAPDVAIELKDADGSEIRRFDFVVQFCWQPQLPSKRKDAKDKAAEKAKPSEDNPTPAAQ